MDGSFKPQSTSTQYALNPLSSSTPVCSPQPTINFRSKTAFVWLSQRFDPRNKRRMHTAYNPELADHATRRTTPAPGLHQSTPRRAYYYSAVRCDQPQVWSNSKSRIGKAPKSAGSIKRTSLQQTLGSARRCACWSQPSAAHTGSAGARVFFPSLGCDIVAKFDGRPHSVYKITCVLP